MRRSPRTISSSCLKSSNDERAFRPRSNSQKTDKALTDPTALTLAEARDALVAKKLSSLELTEAYLGAMERARQLNAFVAETPDKAREMARASDARLAQGEAGPLEGLPIG